MIAPSGNKSNLTPEQYKLVRTPEFKAWFGDWENSPETSSKVVDENGYPLLLYHGTSSNFDIFDIKKAKEGRIGKGFHFTESKDEAKEYGENIIECFLNITQLYNGRNRKTIGDGEYFGIEYSLTGSRVFMVNNAKQIKILENKMSKGGGTIAQTPAPKSDRLKGSKVNKSGSATSEGSSTIELSDKTINTLKGKLEEFKKGNPKNTTITLDDLKAVYRRGSGAYSTSHRPTITGGAPNSRAAWSFARVNKFLQKAAGEKVKAAYVQDDDLFKYEKGGLIAPNGKKSNLTAEQYKLVRTPEFKAWFGDWENSPETSSKVVDENGEPLVMWHYAKRLQYELDKFYTFRVDKQLGSHFGTIQQAQNLKYIPSGESEVKKSNKELSDFRYYKVFLNIKNPIRLKDVGIFEPETLTDAIGNENIKTYNWEYINNYNKTNKDSLLDRVKYIMKSTYGYDGAVYLNRYESDADTTYILSLDDASDKVFKNKVPSAEDSWIAFYPNQIKLADGTNTEFNSENSDIRYEYGGYLNEEAQQYVDIISIDANNPKYSKYKEILKTKFGIDYDLDYANHDENIIDNADLDDLKGISDFLSYDKYVKYAYKIFRKRGFIENQPKHIEGVVSIDLAKKVGSYLGFSVELKEYFGTGNYAANIGDIIFMPNPVDINAFIHEIGHYFDHEYSKEYDGKAKDSLYATSLYEIRKSDEVFAENFMTYFIAPEWLLINMPIVFYELDNKIPQLYKDTINDLIKKVNNSNTSIKYADGGKVKDSLFNELEYVEKHIGYAKTPSQILYLSSKLSGASEQHRQLDGNDRLEFYKKRNELREKIESIKK